MEKLIRENFMAERQIEQEINFTKRNLKEYKWEFGIKCSDEQIDNVCDHVLEAISISFYKIRNNI